MKKTLSTLLSLLFCAITFAQSVPGCIDPAAVNYDPLATVDDGSCIIPAAGKLVVGELATGTWSDWCPRGAVAYNWMEHKYGDYFIPIDVHNGDPMTDAVYDASFSISSFPTVLIDRGDEINPEVPIEATDLENKFLQRLVIPPVALLTNYVQINGNTLNVSIDVDFQAVVNGGFSLACVLVEDSVTGAGSGWSQPNAYSGGAAGPLVDVDGSDWANKPTSVLYTQMIYRHVARGIKPSFNGANITNGNNDTTLSFQFQINSTWDVSQLSIVGMLITDSGTIDNASSTVVLQTPPSVYGCTDSVAINYNPLATIDDGSCVYCDLNIDSLGVTQMTCYSWNNASVNIIATGTQPLPYNYYVVRLNPTDTVSQGNLSITSGLASGVYVAVVEDSLGCIDSDTFTINSLDSVYIDSVIYSNVSCNGMANGYISAIIPMGGTPPYQFSLNGGPLHPSCLCVVSPSCPTGYVFSGLTPGTYTVEIWDSNMCANSYQFTITEPPLVIWQQAFSICDGDSVLVGSSVYHTNGNYIDTLTTGSGCDSVVYTNISIAFPTIWYQTHLICDGDSIVIGNNVYDTVGVYIDTLSSANGCDSIIQTYLMVEQNTYSYDTLSVGASIVWNGMPLNVSGDYSVPLINAAGCDSITNLNLTITQPNSFISGNDTICYNQNIDAEVLVTFTGIAPFAFVYEINGIAQPTIVTASSPYIIFTQQGGIYTLDFFSDANSVGTTSGSAMVFVNTSPIDCPLPSAIAEHSTNKELLKITDLLGRETKQTNQPLFYIYDNGTVEKRMVIE